MANFSFSNENENKNDLVIIIIASLGGAENQLICFKTKIVTNTKEKVVLFRLLLLANSVIQREHVKEPYKQLLNKNLHLNFTLKEVKDAIIK